MAARDAMLPLESESCHAVLRSGGVSAQRWQMTGRPLRGMRIRLVRKLADRLDGIDVSPYREGDVVELRRADARLLIAERWAVPYRGPRPETRVTAAASLPRAAAADQAPRRTVEQLRRVREDMETKRCEQQERRRAEDRIREELQDARAKTLNDRT